MFVAPFALPASLFEVAARIVDRPGSSLLLSTDVARRHGRFSYLACDPVDIVHRLDPLEGERIDSGPFAFVPRFIGVLPYEAMRSRLERSGWTPTETRPPPLIERIEWARFDAVLSIDHEAGTAHIVADDQAAARRLRDKIETSSATPSPFRLVFGDIEAPELHVARVRAAIERIFDGDFYQVNLARELRVSIEPASACAILAAGEALLAASPTPFGAILRTANGSWVLSSTPELLLDATPNASGFDRVATEPIKGTRRRLDDPAADAELALALDADPKDRAELAMIVDVERNNLHRVCLPGSVEVEEPPHVVSHRTVHHRVARVAGTVRPGVTRIQVLASIVPSGSVTGAPKVRAMEAIAELEPVRRGLYTGGIGYAGRDGSMRLAMAIRTAVVDAAGQGGYLVGGGIVADSDPVTELEETRWKSAQIAAIGQETQGR